MKDNFRNPLANVLKAARVFLALGALFAYFFPSHGATVVAPNINAIVPGGGAQSPFDGGRYLNIYNASEFLSAMPEGGIITAVSFRLDESVREPASATVPQFEIRMSTSPVTAGTPKIRFSENVGSDERVVFRGGMRSLRALYLQRFLILLTSESHWTIHSITTPEMGVWRSI